MRKKLIHCPMCDNTKNKRKKTTRLFHLKRFYEQIGLFQTMWFFFSIMSIERPKYMYTCKRCDYEFY